MRERWSLLEKRENVRDVHKRGESILKIKLTLTASKVEPIAIKLEIKRAQNHTLRGDLRVANADGSRVADGVVVEVAIDVE